MKLQEGSLPHTGIATFCKAPYVPEELGFVEQILSFGTSTPPSSRRTWRCSS